jgi:hypothetical protein
LITSRPVAAETAEDVPDAVKRIRDQVKRVGDARIVLRPERRELGAEQARDADVADGMQGHEQHPADQHQQARIRGWSVSPRSRLYRLQR